MTRPKRNDKTINLTKQELLRALTEDDALKKLMQTLLQEVLEAEMDEALLAGKGERTGGRLGYRSGHYTRSLVTRVGKVAPLKMTFEVLPFSQGQERGYLISWRQILAAPKPPR
jgi:transposase-like protein